jgi:hypothetical protein
LNRIHLSFAAALTAAALLWMPAGAQVVVEDGVTTDTVDLFAKSAKPQKSGVLAMCASVLLPGLGHQYLGDNAKALAYYSAEALFIFGGIYCNHYSRTMSANAKTFAWEHAMAAGGAGADDQYWQNVASYDDSKGYNEEMERAYRTEEKNYLAPNLQWRWDDIRGEPVNRKAYGSMLKESLTYQSASTFFIGAMVLNRLVSFIDARFTAKQMETKALSSIQFVPQYDPQTGSSGISLHARF